MCGIYGYIGAEIKNFKEKAETLKHRGPDEFGEFISNNVYLSINRLAIIDIATGQQPISDKLSTIVFNGEIFNSADLKKELSDLGAKFETDHSDTEVIIKGYNIYGTKIFPKLNGMFAIAIYDETKEELILARDTFGIKPLYIKRSKNTIEFGSELKPLIDKETVINNKNIYLTIKRNSRVNFDTYYSAITELAPGKIATISKSLKVIEKEFTFTSNRKIENLPATNKSLREELISAVSRWTISDTPISISLSGGLDSSIIAGILARELGIKPRCYTFELIGYETESLQAEKTADLLGLELIKCSITGEEYFDQIPHMLKALEEPYFGDLPSWFIYKKAQSCGEKVILTGTGADEIFGNYNKGNESLLSKLKSNIRKILSFGLDKNPCDSSKIYGYFPNEISPLIYNKYFTNKIQTVENFSINPKLNRFDAIYSYDKIAQLRSEFLMMTDKFSSAHSIEARTPFLDQEFELIMNNKLKKFKYDGAEYKMHLRNTFSDLLIPEVVAPHKKGFVVNNSEILRKHGSKELQDITIQVRLEQAGIYKNRAVMKLINDFIKNGNKAKLVWAIYVIQNWLKNENIIV